MKALFGVVSLLVALAVVGLVASRQLKAVRPAVVPPAIGGDVAVAPPATTGTVREQARGLQQKVGDDVAKALNQGAAARGDDAAKP